MGVGFRVCVAKSVKFPITVVVNYLFTYYVLKRLVQ